MAESSEFEAIYRRHASKVRRDAYFYLNDPQLAEDVCHDVIIRAFEAQTKFEIRSLGAWITTATRNACIDILRRRSRDVYRDPPDRPQSSIDDEYDRLTRRELVGRAVGRLPGLHQRLIRLTYFGGHSYNEIAKSERLTEASVRDRLHYARSLLKVELRKLGLPLAAVWWRLRDRRNEAGAVARIRAIEVIAGALALSTVLNFGQPRQVEGEEQIPRVVPSTVELIQEVPRDFRKPEPKHLARAAPKRITTPVSVQGPMEEAPLQAHITIGPLFISCSEPRMSGVVTRTLCEVLPR